MPRCSKIWQDMAQHTDAHGHVVVAEVFVARKLVTMVGAQGSEIALNAEAEAIATLYMLYEKMMRNL